MKSDWKIEDRKLLEDHERRISLHTKALICISIVALIESFARFISLVTK